MTLTKKALRARGIKAAKTRKANQVRKAKARRAVAETMASPNLQIEPTPTLPKDDLGALQQDLDRARENLRDQEIHLEEAQQAHRGALASFEQAMCNFSIASRDLLARR